MAIEFRNAFLGFNKDDVLNYVHKKDSDLKQMSVELGAKISALEEKLESLQKEHEFTLKTVAALSMENDGLKAIAKEYEEKSAELELLSTSIGKLYLMSKSTAKTMVDNAEENSELASKQTMLHIENISDTQDSLKEIAQSILAASQSFVEKLDTLNSSLEAAKAKVRENNEEAIHISEEFAELYSKLG
jgi:chromosome segregation ATPase